jgi:hypothetical protein
MNLRIALVVLALAVAGCGPQASNSGDGAADAPTLDAPAPES